jgi:hypothetical protein
MCVCVCVLCVFIPCKGPYRVEVGIMLVANLLVGAVEVLHVILKNI